MNQTEPTFNEPVSALDIVTYGYKAGLKSLWPVTRVVLAFALLYAPLATVYVRAISSQGNSPPDVSMVMFMAAFMLFCLGVTFWSYYAITRYVRDCFRNQVAGNPLLYLLPRWDLLGGMGIGVVYLMSLAACGVMFMAGMIAMMMGLGVVNIVSGGGSPVLFAALGIGVVVLVFLPMLLGINYINTLFGFVFSVYMSSPEKGVFAAFGETFRMMRGHFWRTVGISLMTWVVNFILMLPMGLIGFFSRLLTQSDPTFMDSAAFLIGYTVLAFLGNWVNIAISMSGFVFVLYRYYLDLSLRAEMPNNLVRMADFGDRRERAPGG